MKIRNPFKKFLSLFSLFFLIIILTELLPVSVGGEVNEPQIKAENLTTSINWSDGKLEIQKDHEWQEVQEAQSIEFHPGHYRFTVSWNLQGEGHYQAGDFFTFSVPEEFAGSTFDLKSLQSQTLGTVEINEKGVGIATFTDEIENLNELDGQLTIEGTLSEAEVDVPINWIFDFSQASHYHYVGELNLHPIHPEPPLTDNQEDTVNPNPNESDENSLPTTEDSKGDSNSNQGDTKDDTNSNPEDAKDDTNLPPEDNKDGSSIQPDSTTDGKLNDKNTGSTTSQIKGGESKNLQTTTTGTDISAEITWNSWKLEAPGGSEILPGEEIIFPIGDYKFTASWSAIRNKMYQPGDFFTFQVPQDFAGRKYEAWFSIYGELVLLAKIIIDNNGIGTLTFTEEIDGLRGVNGTIEFRASYSESVAETRVKWDFILSTSPISYEGKSEGTATTPGDGNNIRDIWKGTDKVGRNNPNDLGGTWNIGFTLSAAQLAGTDIVTVIDTFGEGFKLTENWHHVDKAQQSIKDHGHDGGWTCAWYDGHEGQATHGKLFAADTEGYNEHAYFQILALDWEAARQIYNAENPHNYVPEGKMNDDIGEIARDNGLIKPLSIEVTDDGFEITFNANDVKDKNIVIEYWYKRTTTRPIESISNTVKVIGKELITEATGKADLSGSATISGTTGFLTLIKQNQSESRNLSGAKFTLAKGQDSVTEITKENGELVFDLFNLHNQREDYKGTYTLTEVEAPKGYEIGEPMTLKLDENGKIIEINGIKTLDAGTPIENEADQLVSWVAGNRLVMTVYNNPKTTEVTATKKWVDSPSMEVHNPVLIQLYRDGKALGSTYQVELSDQNDWTHTWYDLPEIDEKTGDSFNYTVEEVTVPRGYVATSEWNQDEKTFTITNTYVGGEDLNLIKVNGNNHQQKLSGAEFQLYYEENGKKYYYHEDTDQNVSWVSLRSQATLLTTDEAGSVQFKDLDVGVYQLVEVTAPTGYLLPFGRWQVVIEKEGIKFSSISGTNGILPPGVIKDGDSFLIQNNKDQSLPPELPSTGGVGTLLFLVVGGMLMIVAVVKSRKEVKK